MSEALQTTKYGKRINIMVVITMLVTIIVVALIIFMSTLHEAGLSSSSLYIWLIGGFVLFCACLILGLISGDQSRKPSNDRRSKGPSSSASDFDLGCGGSDSCDGGGGDGGGD